MSEWIERRRAEQCEIVSTEVDLNQPEIVIEIEIRHRGTPCAVVPLEVKWAEFFNRSPLDWDGEE